MFGRRSRLVLPAEDVGPVTLEEVRQLCEVAQRPDKTGVTRNRLEQFLKNPTGFGQTVSLDKAKEILGVRQVVDYAQASGVWVCSTLDPGVVSYSDALLKSAAELNRNGRRFRLVYILGLPFDRQLRQIKEQGVGPRFTTATKRWIAEYYRPLLPPRLASGYWLLDFSIERFLNLSPSEIVQRLVGTFPLELWVSAETACEAAISLACTHRREEERVLTDGQFHKNPPSTFARQWLVGDYREAQGIRVIPVDQVKQAKPEFGKIGVVTAIAR